MKKTNHAILSVLLIAVLLFATLIIPVGAVDTYDTNSGNTVNTVYRSALLTSPTFCVML